MNEFGYAELVVEELEAVKDDLLALYEDIESTGDVHDAAARHAKLALLAEFNDLFEPLERAVDAMLQFIERVTGVAPHRELDDPLSDLTTAPSERLPGPRGHGPSEDFTHRHVVGCEFLTEVYVVSTWGALYERILRALADRDPERFRALPDTPPFNAHDANHRFTRSAADHPQAPRELPYGVYCKGTMAVRDLFINICRLLAHFEIPESQLVIYLREEWKGA